MSTKINIVKKIHPNLGMNQAAKELFDEINQSNVEDVIIDFVDIVFMSRSFTQEYLFQKLTSNKNIIEINVPDNIQKMFEVVSKDFEK